MDKGSNGWWTQTVDIIVTHWNTKYRWGGILGGEKITEIAQRGCHHHSPDYYDIYSGDKLIQTLSVRSISQVQYCDEPAPPHQTFIPTPHTRSTAPPAGEQWCPLTRQACWGEGCTRRLVCDAEITAASKPKRTRTKTAPAEAAND